MKIVLKHLHPPPRQCVKLARAGRWPWWLDLIQNRRARSRSRTAAGRRRREDDKVRTLNDGANDYIVKPFDIRELLARLRAQLRDRTAEPDQAKFEANGLSLDLSARSVTLDGQPVQLTKKEFELLALLARHAGRVVTHTQILEKLWGPGHVDAKQYLRVYVGQLREKLKDSSAEPRFIATLPGVGYKFIG